MKTISILGCGWLGFPLAQFLISKGFIVKGSTATRDKRAVLKEAGIQDYYINLDSLINPDFDPEFFNSEILIINIPPKRRDDIVVFHKQQIEAIVEQIKKSSVNKILFVSSTSVYPNVNGEVTEDEDLEPTKSSGKALKAVENMLMNLNDIQTSVLRLAGLVGYDRMPGRFLSGRSNLKNAKSPVNLIHRDDCILIIHEIIRKAVWGEILNGCCDVHPLRKDYYSAQAKLIGAGPPVFGDCEASDFKIISNKKLKDILKYKFKYPDPREIKETQEE